MSRATRERWLEAEAHWPNLQQFLACYFHQDCTVEFKTLEEALDRAIAGWTLDGRRLVLREWRDWNAKRGWRNDAEAYVGDGFGVDLLFEDDVAARKFMNRVYERLIGSVRADFGKGWKE